MIRIERAAARRLASGYFARSDLQKATASARSAGLGSFPEQEYARSVDPKYRPRGYNEGPKE